MDRNAKRRKRYAEMPQEKKADLLRRRRESMLDSNFVALPTSKKLYPLVVLSYRVAVLSAGIVSSFIMSSVVAHLQLQVLALICCSMQQLPSCIFPT